MRNAIVVVLVVGVAIGAWLAYGQATSEDATHTDRPIAAWIRQLDHADVERRYEAGLRLSAYGAQAVPALVERLRRDAEKAADERGDPDAEGEPRQVAAHTLALIGRPAVPALIETLGVDSHYERALAQTALLTIGLADEDLEDLVPLLAHENPITAGMAGHLIGVVPGGRAALELALENDADDERIVQRALLTISRLEQDRPGALTSYLAHPSPLVRREALHVLRLVGAAPAQAEPIAALLGDDDEQVQSWAATVLRRMKRDAQFALVAVARDGGPQGARLALGLLGELGRDALSAVPVLRSRLEDPTPAVRAAAAEALHAVTGLEDEALPILIDLVDAESRHARIHAVAALGGFGESAEALAELLRPLLKDPDVEVARVAAISLGHLGPRAKAAVQALEEAAGSPNRELARAASMALQMLRGTGGD